MNHHRLRCVFVFFVIQVLWLSQGFAMGIFKVPPTVELTADRTEIVQGESVTLSWSSTHADSCYLEPDISQSSSCSGTEQVSPTQTTTYTFSASNEDGDAATEVTVTVIWPDNDLDGDGVTDDLDICPGTPVGKDVDANGCSLSQKDTDKDGVTDDLDLCGATPDGESVDPNGCSESQKDSDSDGVMDNNDICAGTPVGEVVDVNGCSDSQKDTDNDGVTDDLDTCPETVLGDIVDLDGCSYDQLDDDGDGVANGLDVCPGTPLVETVDSEGCAYSQLDDDGDGVKNGLDRCRETPEGETVDIVGCSDSQKDTDGDGVTDNVDTCSDTFFGETVDLNGCAYYQLDDDNDGVVNGTDRCAETPEGEAVDEIGCAYSQLDDDGDGIANESDLCPDTPLVDAPPPAVMIIMDDSSSMDAEILTTEPYGYFGYKAYVFQDGIDDSTIVLKFGNINGESLLPSAEELRRWKSQWYGYNKIYYNPGYTYTPWPDTESTQYTFGQASTKTPKYDPRENKTIWLNDPFFDSWDGGIGESYIRNSHYFLYDEPTGRIFLVNLIPSYSGSREYYELEDSNGNETIDSGELLFRSLSQLPASLQEILTVTTPESDLQNFANWFQYYRKRYLFSIGAIAQTVNGLLQVQVGLYSINQSVIQSVLPIKAIVNSGQDTIYKDATDYFLTALYTEYVSSGNAYLRSALADVGEYFRGNIRNEELGIFYFDTHEGGPYQKTYSILMNDGFWVDDTPFRLTDYIPVVPSEDPDQDGYPNTLADVAAAYFQTDLDPDTDDQLTTTPCNKNSFQHMVTFGVSFGLSGRFNPEDYSHCNGALTGTEPYWGDPHCWGNDSQCDIPEKIDDLWHATVNSQGAFFNVSNPDALIMALENIFKTTANLNNTIVDENGCYDFRKDDDE